MNIQADIAELGLGLLALKDQDIDSAVSHLIQAGNSPGSPQLNSFGPRMTLAAELVRRGQIAPVLRYLGSIGKFFGVDKSPCMPKLQRERRKRIPWWLRWIVPRELTPQQTSEFVHDNRRLLRGWKDDVRAGRVPNDKRWVKQL